MLSGTDKHGFAVLRSSPLPELEAVMHYMRHERTGLELVWIERAEANRTFGIAFPTLPEDDTGVFHILEHSVLCGSELLPGQGALRGAHEDLHEHLPQRHDLPGQDLLPHLQPQPARTSSTSCASISTPCSAR